MNTKKLLLLFLTVVLVCCVFFVVACKQEETPSQPNRDTEEILPVSNEGMEFEPNQDGNSYTLTSIGICLDDEITIGSYQGKPVTKIAENAFFNCNWITKIEMSNKVVEIGKSAFEECNDLESITLSNAVTTINEKTFYNCLVLKR